MNQLLVRLLLLFGASIMMAAIPALLPTPETDCKTSAQLGATPGDIKCDTSIRCDVTGQTCRKTKWHAQVQDPYVYFCSCTTSGEFSGPDPTTGLCMAYTVENGSGFTNLCSKGDCMTGEKCLQEKLGAYKKCVCRNP